MQAHGCALSLGEADLLVFFVLRDEFGEFELPLVDSMLAVGPNESVEGLFVEVVEDGFLSFGFESHDSMLRWWTGHDFQRSDYLSWRVSGCLYGLVLFALVGGELSSPN